MIREVDPSNFLRMIEGLRQVSGRDFEYLLVDQTAAVLKNCISHTPAAKPGAIVKRVSRHNSYIEFSTGEVIAIWKKAGNVQMFLDASNFVPSSPGTKNPRKAPLIINGKSWHEMNPGNGGSGRHWSSERWGRFQALLQEADRMKENAEKALGARGLTKQSFLQAAQDLGLDAGKVGAPGYVQQAKPSNGQIYKNGYARKILEAGALFIELVNDNPILVDRLNGASILQAGIDSRAKAFEIEMQKGVFDDMATRAKRYPGIFTTA